MNLVLLSGGSGKRLWPLSNDSRSKQFLKVLKSNQSNYESMIQRVWKQLGETGLAKSTVIATSGSQVEMIQSQVGVNVPLVIEPARRDTFPAIALAASYLYSIKKVPLDKAIAVLPVDPFVETSFFNKVKELENVLNSSDANIALMGVDPTFPSEKYGYIVPSQEEIFENYIAVSHFVEKPNEEQAKELIEKNALWNCGVFAFKLEYIIGILKTMGFPTGYEQLLDIYETLPKDSFDYEVLEKEEKIVVLPYDGYWKDLGTWNTLTDEMNTKIIGKGIISDDSFNTHLVNELDLPITVLGISNAVVAASPDGILVTDKEASPRIKEVMKNFEQRPMYEERRWGWYKVLDFVKLDDGNEVLTKRICIKSGKNLSYQLHDKRSEVWTIIKGEGQLVLNEEIRNVRSGDVLKIPVGVRHAIKAISDLEIVEVQNGSELIEEDIHRIYINWEDIVKNCINQILTDS